MLTYPKRIFGKTIFRPIGGAAPPNFYVRQRMTKSQCTPHRGRGPPYNFFFKWGSKIGLKCNKGALITSELGVQPNETSALDAALGGGVNASTTFGGTAPPLKFVRAKNAQNLVRFTTTFEFECKQLWNRCRQRQNLNGVDENDFFGVEQKNLLKFGPLRTKL